MKKTIGFLLVVGLMVGAMAAVAFYAERAIMTWLYVFLPHKLAQWIGVPMAIVLGAAVYFTIARLFRFPELGFVMDALRARKQKKAAEPAE